MCFGAAYSGIKFEFLSNASGRVSVCLGAAYSGIKFEFLSNASGRVSVCLGAAYSGIKFEFLSNASGRVSVCLGAAYSGIKFEFLTNASGRVSHVHRFFLDLEITRRLYPISLDFYSFGAVFEHDVVITFCNDLSSIKICKKI